MYILEKGYWTMTDLKTKAMKAAYDEAVKHDRKIVYPNELDDLLRDIMNSVELAARNSKGVKMPLLYTEDQFVFGELERDRGIFMEGNPLIVAKKLFIERYYYTKGE